MNSFLRWFTINGIILALFLVGVLTQSPSIYFAFAAIGAASFAACIFLALPTGIAQMITSTPFWGKRFFDAIYDIFFIAALIFFGFYIWAIVYVPILIASQLHFKETV